MKGDEEVLDESFSTGCALVSYLPTGRSNECRNRCHSPQKSKHSSRWVAYLFLRVEKKEEKRQKKRAEALKVVE